MLLKSPVVVLKIISRYLHRQMHMEHIDTERHRATQTQNGTERERERERERQRDTQGERRGTVRIEWRRYVALLSALAHRLEGPA